MRLPRRAALLDGQAFQDAPDQHVSRNFGRFPRQIEFHRSEGIQVHRLDTRPDDFPIIGRFQPQRGRGGAQLVGGFSFDRVGFDLLSLQKITVMMTAQAAQPSMLPGMIHQPGSIFRSIISNSSSFTSVSFLTVEVFQGQV